MHLATCIEIYIIKLNIIYSTYIVSSSCAYILFYKHYIKFIRMYLNLSCQSPITISLAFLISLPSRLSVSYVYRHVSEIYDNLARLSHPTC